MREIKTHSGNLLNNSIKIIAIGEPSPGGASRTYRLIRPSAVEGALPVAIDLVFQEGNPADSINGISGEALMAVVIDRLEGFQNGPLSHWANDEALRLMRGALSVLQARTTDRAERGVEGTLRQ